jgi:hypothetical protein
MNLMGATNEKELTDELNFLKNLREQYKQGSCWLDAFERSIKMVDKRIEYLHHEKNLQKLWK